MPEPTLYRGIVHGNRIELEQALGLPEGQPVSVAVMPLVDGPLPEGLRSAFGGWADDSGELDAFLEWNREQRQRVGV